MPRVAYLMPGAVSAAFTPVPACDGRGFGPWQGKAAVAGQPGTLGVPTGLPDFGNAGAVVNGHSVRGGGAGYAQGSGTMPGVWYPSLYWLRGLDGFTLNVPGQAPSIFSDNQMPVPAANPIGAAAVLAKPPVFLGQGQVANPPGSKGGAFFSRVRTALTTGYVGPGSYGG
jgi:hypothetical protein